jgi:hypothetical protein
MGSAKPSPLETVVAPASPRAECLPAEHHRKPPRSLRNAIVAKVGLLVLLAAFELMDQTLPGANPFETQATRASADVEISSMDGPDAQRIELRKARLGHWQASLLRPVQFEVEGELWRAAARESHIADPVADLTIDPLTQIVRVALPTNEHYAYSHLAVGIVDTNDAAVGGGDPYVQAQMRVKQQTDRAERNCDVVLRTTQGALARFLHKLESDAFVFGVFVCVHHDDVDLAESPCGEFADVAFWNRPATVFAPTLAANVTACLRSTYGLDAFAATAVLPSQAALPPVPPDHRNAGFGEPRRRRIVTIPVRAPRKRDDPDVWELRVLNAVSDILRLLSPRIAMSGPHLEHVREIFASEGIESLLHQVSPTGRLLGDWTVNIACQMSTP